MIVGHVLLEQAVAMRPDMVIRGRVIAVRESAAGAVFGRVREHDHVDVAVVVAGIGDTVRPIVIELTEVHLSVDPRECLPESGLHPGNRRAAEESVTVGSAERIAAAGSGNTGVRRFRTVESHPAQDLSRHAELVVGQFLVKRAERVRISAWWGR